MNLKYVYEENYKKMFLIFIGVLFAISLIYGIFMCFYMCDIAVFWFYFSRMVFVIFLFSFIFLILPIIIVLYPICLFNKLKNKKIKKNGKKETGILIAAKYINPGAGRSMRTFKKLFASYLIIDINGELIKIKGLSNTEDFLKLSKTEIEDLYTLDVYCHQNNYFADLKTIKKLTK